MDPSEKAKLYLAHLVRMFVNLVRLRLSDQVVTLSRAFVTRLEEVISFASGSNKNHLTPETNKFGRYC